MNKGLPNTILVFVSPSSLKIRCKFWSHSLVLIDLNGNSGEGISLYTTINFIWTISFSATQQGSARHTLPSHLIKTHCSKSCSVFAIYTSLLWISLWLSTFTTKLLHSYLHILLPFSHIYSNVILHHSIKLFYFKNASDRHVAKSNDNVISHHLSSYPFFVRWTSSQAVLFSVPFTGSSSSTRPTNIVVTYLYVKHFQYYIRGFLLNSRLTNTNVHIEFT